MPSFTCTCCGKPSEPHKTINCFICNKPFWIECVNISSAEVRKIHLHTGMTWTCKKCLKFGDDLASLKSVIVSLQDEVKALKNTIRESTPCDNVSSIQAEMIIQEIQEREKRKNNIIIYGSRESNCDSNKKQIDLDTVLIKEMCDELKLSDDDLKVFRLGRFDPTKTDSKRPIRVTFSNESRVVSVLRGLSKLRKVPSFSNVSIYRDRTPMQAQLHKDMKAKLVQRLDDGETNLVIKYVKGVPSIVSTSKN